MGVATRVLSVDQAHLQSISSTMRTQQGVRSVGQVGLRYPMIVSAPYFTNDPYFQGFNSPVGPYYETASVPGQWDMHAIGLEHAFAYSQAGDAPTGFMNANALGNSSIKLAIIDTGEDTGHPELHAKVAYQKCFITNQSNNQSTSNFTTDPDGHGTDVSGIALADLNNGLGFVGAGGKVSLYAYRVFPTPDSYTSCSPGSTSTDPTCTATTIDIADAINDAVSHGVNVISMSLGGGTCSGGQDPDSLEGNAIANAIAAHIIVVAASGNAGTSGVDAPACDSSVIAAGASALGDGQPNGTNSDGSTSSPVEYVASYSQYGSPGASAHSSSAWGIVAPGGDPTGSSDGDDLHWIENIWTSVPYDPQDAGTCSGDYPNDTGTVDCRILIAGTSMATPHVAGAAALIESVTSAYSTPAAMKQLLCSTADDISDPHEGCGRLNIYRAMAKALGDPNLP
jgi:subtilisin family serine protease